MKLLERWVQEGPNAYYQVRYAGDQDRELPALSSRTKEVVINK